MNVTNADVAKRALVDLLAAQAGVGGPLYQVQVEYVDPGQETFREVIYPGAVAWNNDGDQEIRLEVASIPLYIAVVDPGRDPRDTDLRAKALAAVVHDVLTANPKPVGPSSWWAVTGGQMIGARTGDESRSTLTLQIEVRSYV